MRIDVGDIEETEEKPKHAHLEATPFRYQYDDLSYLTLGGYDENDYNGTMTWFDTSDTPNGWNMTA